VGWQGANKARAQSRSQQQRLGSGGLSEWRCLQTLGNGVV